MHITLKSCRQLKDISPRPQQGHIILFIQEIYLPPLTSLTGLLRSTADFRKFRYSLRRI
jgi:hypothetical protein